jgi:hypothetical protein
VHPDPRARIYIELAVDHHVVSQVNRHVCGEAGVVVDLEDLAGGEFDVESLTTVASNVTSAPLAWVTMSW